MTHSIKDMTMDFERAWKTLKTQYPHLQLEGRGSSGRTLFQIMSDIESQIKFNQEINTKYQVVSIHD